MSDQKADLLWQLREAEAMQHGAVQFGLLEEIVRLSDLQNDLDAGFRARQALVRSGYFSGQPSASLVAFSWCLAQSDKEPERFPEGELLGPYKWVVAKLAGFPEVSLDQIQGVHDDLRHRFERAGYGENASLKLRLSLAIAIGDRAYAENAFARWKESSREGISDCAACDRQEEVYFALFMGRYRKAIKLAEPILNGLLRCTSVPHQTFADVLVPLVQLNRLEEAVKYHKTGYRMISQNEVFLFSMARHVTFLGLTDNANRGIKVMEKHLSWALKADEPDNRFEFYLACLFLMERVLKTGIRKFKARLPRSFPRYERAGEYDAEHVQSWFAKETHDLALRFDERNGSNYYCGRIRELASLHEVVVAHPFK